MVTFNNYRIKGSEGVFYTTSKTPQEGYEENRYINPQTKDEGVNYHKTKSNLKGKLNKVDITEVDYGGGRGTTMLRLFIESEKDVVDVLQIDVYVNKRTSDWIRSITPYLGNLELGKDIEIWLNRKSKDKSGYLYKNIFFKQDDEKIGWAYHPKDDVPAWESIDVVNKLTKKVTKEWNTDKLDEFVLNRLSEYIEAIGNQTVNTSAAPSTSNMKEEVSKPDTDVVVKTKKAVEAEIDDSDDLPF